MVRDMHSDDPQQLELLRVCRIGRAQGLKGEVTVQIFTDEPEYRFAPGAVLYTKDGEEEYVVESSRTFKTVGSSNSRASTTVMRPKPPMAWCCMAKRTIRRRCLKQTSGTRRT